MITADLMKRKARSTSVKLTLGGYSFGLQDEDAIQPPLAAINGALQPEAQGENFNVQYSLLPLTSALQVDQKTDYRVQQACMHRVA